MTGPRLILPRELIDSGAFFYILVSMMGYVM